MNPMIRKEFRQRMRERRSWLLPSLYLITLCGAVALAYYFATEEVFSAQQKQIQGAEVGIALFYTVAFTQIALLLLMAPVFSAGNITIEKEQRTLPALLTSLLSASQIWWGKFVAAVLFLVLLLISALPVLSLSFSMGGVDSSDVALAFGTTLVIVASVCAVGLFYSSYFRRSVHSTAVTYATVIAISAITFITYLLLGSWWQSSHGSADTPRYFTIPLYLNPFFPLSVLIHDNPHRFQDWAISLITFACLGLAAALLAIRNLKRSGSQV